LYREWFENEKQMEKCTYLDGKRDGLYQRWNDNGEIIEGKIKVPDYYEIAKKDNKKI
jgi:antitoxin component YwqK of YwqJK toxin-antitoxin module